MQQYFDVKCLFLPTEILLPDAFGTRPVMGITLNSESYTAIVCSLFTQKSNKKVIKIYTHCILSDKVTEMYMVYCKGPFHQTLIGG